MSKLAEIQSFISVVDAGGISAAADRLNVAKSAVSRRLTELEKRLGVQLLRRTTRRLTLTDSGRSFYERCARIIADLDEAEQAVSQAHGALRGAMRITVPSAFGVLHLAPAITDFMSLHPGVEFDIDFNDRHVDLVQEGFDLAVRIARLSDSSLIARRLAPIRNVVCASPAYLDKHGTPRLPQDLSQHDCLVYSNLATPDRWQYGDADDASLSVKVGVKLKTSSGDFLRVAALAGQGIIMLPTFYLYDDIANRRLVPLLTDYRWPTLNAYALYPPTRHLSTRVRAFVDFLAQRFAGTPYWDRDTAADTARAP